MSQATNHYASENSNNLLFEGLISEKEYARQRGVSLRTVQRDRQLRQGPPYILIGRKVYYRVEAVRDWVLSRERDPRGTSTAHRTGKRR